MLSRGDFLEVPAQLCWSFRILDRDRVRVLFGVRGMGRTRVETVGAQGKVCVVWKSVRENWEKPARTAWRGCEERVGRLGVLWRGSRSTGLGGQYCCFENKVGGVL